MQKTSISTKCVSFVCGTLRVFIELLTLGCADDPEVYKGMPVGIQLVGPTLQEEVVLGAGEVIDAVLSSSRRD